MLPAYAGMIPGKSATGTHSARAPRVCGDDPAASRASGEGLRCSPRMRG